MEDTSQSLAAAVIGAQHDWRGSQAPFPNCRVSGIVLERMVWDLSQPDSDYKSLVLPRDSAPLPIIGWHGSIPELARGGQWYTRVLSQEHAALIYNDTNVLITDFKSQNGTYIHRGDNRDDEKVPSFTYLWLKDGDIITFGHPDIAFPFPPVSVRIHFLYEPARQSQSPATIPQEPTPLTTISRVPMQKTIANHSTRSALIMTYKAIRNIHMARVHQLVLYVLAMIGVISMVLMTAVRLGIIQGELAS